MKQAQSEFSEIELLLHRLYVLKMRGKLDSLIKADKTGTIQKAMDTYTLTVERFNQIDDSIHKGRNRNHAAARDMNKNLTSLPTGNQTGIEVTRALMKVLRPVRHLSFFERQTARALGKSVDSTGHIDLNENANRASGQSLNRNFRVANASTEEMFGKTETTEDLAKAELIKMRSYCAQRCKMQGNTRCPYCKGAGFAAMGEPSRNVNKAREIQAKNRNSSRV